MKQNTMLMLTIAITFLAVLAIIWYEVPPFQSCYLVEKACNPWFEDCTNNIYEECTNGIPINTWTVSLTFIIIGAIIYKIINWAES